MLLHKPHSQKIQCIKILQCYRHIACTLAPGAYHKWCDKPRLNLRHNAILLHTGSCGPTRCTTSGSVMPIAAICLVDRPYADLGITSCDFSWTGDELGNDSG